MTLSFSQIVNWGSGGGTSNEGDYIGIGRYNQSSCQGLVAVLLTESGAHSRQRAITYQLVELNLIR
jgi:hypothetical protein